MKHLKNIIIAVTVIVTLVMMAATVIEASQGTPFVKEHIYSSVWFVAIWGVLAVCSAVYIIGKKLYAHLAAFMIHISFLVILIGALTTWLTAESGDIHLRKGESTSQLQLPDKTTRNLGFRLSLKQFRVEYYPGTDAPMDYVSVITADGEDINISMNNIGESHGYRFTQAGYDSDMLGTRLSVTHDPFGITITYVGYCLLFASLLLTLLSKRTRMRHYYHKALGKQAVRTLLVLLAMAAGTAATSHAQQRIEIDKSLADDFSKICVLYNSRICPINTVATDYVTKLSGKPTWNGMSANEIFMGWVFDVVDWESVRMIEIKDKDVQHILGIQDKWASFNDFCSEYNEYKLQKPLDEASHSGNNALLKKLRAADEKFNIIRMLYNGELLRMFPYTDKKGKVIWLAPGEKNVHGNLPSKEWYFVRKSMDYLAESIIMGDKARAASLIDKIYRYQHIRGHAVIPSKTAVRGELVYNSINTQRWPVMLYLTLSLLLIIASTLQLKAKWERWASVVSKVMMPVMLLHTTVLLVLRWWVSGHLPMSNGFETMQFMAWAVLLITIFARRRFPIIERFGLLLASFALLVAMITDGNPQITQLMPVLQSPLLSLHVMMIMFSYSLFGLMALIGIQGIVAHHRKDFAKEESLAALSCMLLYPAVSLLATGVFIGAIWANVSWGNYWTWDAKEVWALITMLVYSAPLHDVAWLRSPRSKHIYLLLAFLCVLMTYFGVNYVLGGMHSYA